MKGYPVDSKLREAIEDVIKWSEEQVSVSDPVSRLKDVYEEARNSTTVTMGRVEFLESRLKEGMSKRDAAAALTIHDPRIGRKTAETIVYTVFSGVYRTSLRGRRSKPDVDSLSDPSPVKPDDPPSISSDEALL